MGILTTWQISDVDCNDAAALATACDAFKVAWAEAAGVTVAEVITQCTCCGTDRKGKWAKKKCKKKTSTAAKKAKKCAKTRFAKKCAGTCCGS